MYAFDWSVPDSEPGTRCSCDLLHEFLQFDQYNINLLKPKTYFMYHQL
jgi:hypothetical protein